MKYTAEAFLELKGKKHITMLTAYTTPVAKCLEKAEIPILLIGDSLGMTEMGFKSTREVTIEHMQYHVGAVRRGAPNTHIIGDMTYNTYEDPETALRNARLLVDAGADSVKLEGPKYDVIRHLRSKGIDVVGHTGLTPQTATSLKQVGKDAEDADRILEEAAGIAEAGAFMLVLEHIPSSLAERVTSSIHIPTIGIGAGKSCDGQVMVINDVIGLGDYFPPFSKQYAHVSDTITDAAARFRQEVEESSFPN